MLNVYEIQDVRHSTFISLFFFLWIFCCSQVCSRQIKKHVFVEQKNCEFLFNAVCHLMKVTWRQLRVWRPLVPVCCENIFYWENEEHGFVCIGQTKTDVSCYTEVKCEETVKLPQVNYNRIKIRLATVRLQILVLRTSGGILVYIFNLYMIFKLCISKS